MESLMAKAIPPGRCNGTMHGSCIQLANQLHLDLASGECVSLITSNHS
jgi:hypothetical protein